MANRRVAAVRAPRRSRVWLGFHPVQVSLGAVTNVMLTMVTDAALLAFGRPTLARIRGQAMATMAESVAGDARGAIHWGVTTITSNVLVGYPLPRLQADEGWIAWGVMFVGRQTLGTVDAGMNVDRQVVDSKAMRKIPVGHKLVMVVEHDMALLGSPVIQFNVSVRFLLMPS